MKQTLKRIYSAIPFKKQLFTAVRLLKPSQGIYQHLHFKGVIKVPVANSNFKINHYGNQVENDLFWAGFKNWESVSLDLWTRLSRSSVTILDVGANTGVYSLISGAVNPAASIYAFEPHPGVYKRLVANAALNTFKVKTFPIAASNSNGETSFYVSQDDFSYTASLNKDHMETNTREIKVETKTLDSFVSEQNLLPDLVKIDVERFEPEVIQGFMNTIRRHHPTMLIEVLDDEIGAKLKDLLQDTRYQYYSINETKGTITRMAEMGKSEEFNVLICTLEVAGRLGI